MEVPLSPFLLCLLFLILPISTSSQFLSGDTTALFVFKSGLARRTKSLDSWSSTNYTCTAWVGITCNSTDTGPRVFELRLPGTGLTGTIPSSTLSQLTSLRTLSLRFNTLTSPLPDDLANHKNLTGIYLQNNKFTGPIPSVLFTIYSLQRLDLSSNNFSGPVPIEFNNLTGLTYLFLQYNNLSGEMPQTLNIPNLAQFNISYNNLTGPIPPSLRKFPASAFLGMKMCGGPLGPCANETPAPSPSPSSQFGPSLPPSSGNGKTKKILSGGAIAGITIGITIGCVGLLALLLLFFLFRRKRYQQSRDGKLQGTDIVPGPLIHSADEAHSGLVPVDTSFEPNPSAVPAIPAAMAAVPVVTAQNKRKLTFFRKAEGVKFNLEDLLRASAEVLGKGTFGTTYKAGLESGEMIAVKMLKDIIVPEKEFREFIARIGALEHKNIVPLLAYYFSKDEKLLVNDFMSMGSVSAVLHGTRTSGHTPLKWETRRKIVLAVSHGIQYIHSASPYFSHGNIKSSNVLLTTTYEARLSDLGLFSLASPQNPFVRFNANRAPEVTNPKKISQKADIFSFGVLILELLTGKAPGQTILDEDEGIDLPRWVQSVLKEEAMEEVFDKQLVSNHNVREDMVQLLKLATDCTALHPDVRPSIAQVVARIEEIVKKSGSEKESASTESGDETRRSPL